MIHSTSFRTANLGMDSSFNDLNTERDSNPSTWNFKIPLVLTKQIFSSNTGPKALSPHFTQNFTQKSRSSEFERPHNLCRVAAQYVAYCQDVLHLYFTPLDFMRNVPADYVGKDHEEAGGTSRSTIRVLVRKILDEICIYSAQSLCPELVYRIYNVTNYLNNETGKGLFDGTPNDCCSWQARYSPREEESDVLKQFQQIRDTVYVDDVNAARNLFLMLISLTRKLKSGGDIEGSRDQLQLRSILLNRLQDQNPLPEVETVIVKKDKKKGTLTPEKSYKLIINEELLKIRTVCDRLWNSVGQVGVL